MQQLLQNIFSDNTLFILLFHFNSDMFSANSTFYLSFLC